MLFPFLSARRHFIVLLVCFQSVVAHELQFDGPGSQSILEQVIFDQIPISNHSNTADACSYWLENISHSGVAPFASSGYSVFRNVKDAPYNAKGDGITDDTAAINLAISDGGRCAPGSCPSSTTTPAIVYFPPGTYSVSSAIIDYYYTQLVGNPNCMPVIQAAPNFSGNVLIDADPYADGHNGNQPYQNTNVFWRSINSLVLDMTLIPPTQLIQGVHWPTAQAT